MNANYCLPQLDEHPLAMSMEQLDNHPPVVSQPQDIPQLPPSRSFMCISPDGPSQSDVKQICYSGDLTNDGSMVFHIQSRQADIIEEWCQYLGILSGQRVGWNYDEDGIDITNTPPLHNQ